MTGAGSGRGKSMTLEMGGAVTGAMAVGAAVTGMKPWL